MSKNKKKLHRLPSGLFSELAPVKPRKKYEALKANLPDQENIDQLSKILLKQINDEIFQNKYAKVKPVLKLVAAGFFLAGSLVMPNLPKTLAPFFNENEEMAWKRFNVRYLKRTLERLEKQKMVQTSEENGMQIVKITKVGKVKVLRAALDELAVKKPKSWDGFWWLVTYDLPKEFKNSREVLRNYLRAWGFYPLQESVFLHAYPCREPINFLREYLGISQYVRLFKIASVENSQVIKDFFGI